jgi:uncharacterized protein (DUF433 family)
VRGACDLDPVFADLLPHLRACEDEGGPLFSPRERIVAAARRFARLPEDRARFARAAALRSVNPAVLPAEPGSAKAVLFAGDALYAAGFVAPVDDGRYQPAGAWPDCPLFQPVGPSWAAPGDLVVVGAHIEVITEVFGGSPVIVTLGARPEGLVEDWRYGARLLRAGRRADYHVPRGQVLHVLRVTVQTP